MGGGGIGGIGAVGAGISMGAGAAPVGASAVQGATAGAEIGASAAASTPAASPGDLQIHSAGNMNIEQLTQFLKDFSSAEILIALMMLSGGRGKDDDSKGGGSDAAMALLAGMALGAQMSSCQSPAATSMVSPTGGAMGGSLNMIC